MEFDHVQKSILLLSVQTKLIQFTPSYHICLIKQLFNLLEPELFF